MITPLLVVYLVQFTGPDDQKIEVNPAEVVSTRIPRSEEHFAKGVRCLINTVDGKFIAVIQTCEQVHKLLEMEKMQ